MKSKFIKIMTIIGIFSLLPIFMGQDDCQVNETINKLFDTMNKKLTTPPGQSKLYITHLTFMDALTKTSIANTEVAELINDAVIKGMNEAQKNNPKLAINEPGHIVPNTDKNNNDLVNVTFDPNLTRNQKVNKIITDIMNPNNVDVIVTGHYIDDAQNPQVHVRPLVIVKHNQKIITRNLQFAKTELICTDPNTANRKILCKGAHDQIAQAVQELLEEL
jgi:hypothetical protein